MRAQLLGDLPADGVDRRERRHRVLEDHRDLRTADGAHLALRQRHQVAAAQEDLARDDRVRVADQPHHGHHRDGLAGARLADDADDVVVVDRQREAVDRAHEPVLRPERHVQVADLEQRLRHGAPAGRATRR